MRDAAANRFGAPDFDDDARVLLLPDFAGERIDAAHEYLLLRESYATLRELGQHDRADALAGEAPRFLHRLACAGLLAAPRAA